MPVHGVEQDVVELLLRRNSDGGFGFLDGYPSSVIDSLMALDALVLADVDDDDSSLLPWGISPHCSTAVVRFPMTRMVRQAWK